MTDQTVCTCPATPSQIRAHCPAHGWTPRSKRGPCPDCLGNGVIANAGGNLPDDNCCSTCNGSGAKP